MRSPSALLVGSLAAAMLACGGTGSPTPSPSACGGIAALVAVSDYASSGVGGISLDGRGTLSVGVDLGQDPALTVSRGRAFFVARDSDVIFELDPHCGMPIKSYALHDPAYKRGSNLQDVAVAPDGALWVPRFNAPSSIAIVRPGGATDAIDLSPYDADKNPNASSIRIVDVAGVAKAFIVLERLDEALQSKQPSMMLRVDVATAKVEAAIALEGRNPLGLAFEAEGALWLAEPGNGDLTSSTEPLAGIERFDSATSTTKLLVHETDLGGSAVAVAVSGTCGAAIVAGTTSANATSLVTFDAASGAVLSRTVIGPTPNYDLQGLAWVREGNAQILLVGDRRATAGGYALHALDRVGDCDLRARADAIFVRQKPVGLRPVP